MKGMILKGILTPTLKFKVLQTYQFLQHHMEIGGLLTLLQVVMDPLGQVGIPLLSLGDLDPFLVVDCPEALLLLDVTLEEQHLVMGLAHLMEEGLLVMGLVHLMELPPQVLLHLSEVVQESILLEGHLQDRV